MTAADATSTAARPPVQSVSMRPPALVVYVTLIAVLCAVALLATTIGAAGIPLPRLAAALGLKIASADPAMLAPHFSRLALIAIIMPGFADGRAFSLARRLRRGGFAGTLRIVGPMIADQFPYALACGVDQVELPQGSADRQPEGQWAKAAATISLGYQRGLHRPTTILDQRRAARAGASDVA